MIIDAQYKMHYRSSHIHQDIRQVAGYARLNKVYKELKKPEDSTEMIDCLIIYPEVGDLPNTYQLEMGNRKTIEAYKKVFKVESPESITLNKLEITDSRLSTQNSIPSIGIEYK